MVSIVIEDKIMEMDRARRDGGGEGAFVCPRANKRTAGSSVPELG